MKKRGYKETRTKLVQVNFPISSSSSSIPKLFNDHGYGNLMIWIGDHQYPISKVLSVSFYKYKIESTQILYSKKS